MRNQKLRLRQKLRQNTENVLIFSVVRLYGSVRAIQTQTRVLETEISSKFWEYLSFDNRRLNKF
jgi:hypothetical protein